MQKFILFIVSSHSCVFYFNDGGKMKFIHVVCGCSFSCSRAAQSSSPEIDLNLCKEKLFTCSTAVEFNEQFYHSIVVVWDWREWKIIPINIPDVFPVLDPFFAMSQNLWYAWQYSKKESKVATPSSAIARRLPPHPFVQRTKKGNFTLHTIANLSRVQEKLSHSFNSTQLC